MTCSLYYYPGYQKFVFACDEELRRPQADTSAAEDTTETANRAWKVPGTQGTLLLDLAFEWSASSDHATANPVIV